jgi:signal transduction histidine kinase
VTQPGTLTRRSLFVLAGAALLVDAAAAWHAASLAPWVDPRLALLDLGVGLAFVAAAGWAPGPVAQRAWVAAVGAGWLAGSWLPAAALLHQGLLTLALLAFPSGRIRGVPRWVAAGLAVLLGLGVLRPTAGAAVFLLVAGICLRDRRGASVAWWYPTVAAGTAGLVLGVIHLWPLDPGPATLAWQVTVLAVAVAYLPAATQLRRDQHRLADRVLEASSQTGLAGLAEIVGQALGDPTLRIHAPKTADSGAPRGDQAPGGDPREGPLRPGRRRLPVLSHGRVVAVVHYATAGLDDPATSQAVTAAVLLTATHEELLERQGAALADLEASRLRLLTATDTVRQRIAQTLRTEVEAPLGEIAAKVAAARSEMTAAAVGERDQVIARDALDVVLSELAAVGEEIQSLVAGVPPVDLGGGRLGAALQSLASGCPVPVTVTVDENSAAGAQAEAALFYACSEGLANAVKHASPCLVEIAVRRRGVLVEARVSDDGPGGADPGGSGLHGLADRLAACGGRLRVDSAPGAGTVLSAVVPG